MSCARPAGTSGRLRALLSGTQAAPRYYTDMHDPEDPSSTSRLPSSPGSLTPHGAHATTRVCDSCKWPVTHTRRFRGRMMCLLCIGDYFGADGEEDEEA